MDQFNQGPAPSITSMGDEYDPTAAYAVRDLCIHDNKLMKCTTAIATGGEAWNDAHWTETTIADEIDELNGKLSWKLLEEKNNTDAINLPSGTWNEIIAFATIANTYGWTTLQVLIPNSYSAGDYVSVMGRNNAVLCVGLSTAGIYIVDSASSAFVKWKAYYR